MSLTVGSFKSEIKLLVVFAVTALAALFGMLVTIVRLVVILPCVSILQMFTSRPASAISTYPETSPPTESGLSKKSGWRKLSDWNLTVLRGSGRTKS